MVSRPRALHQPSDFAQGLLAHLAQRACSFVGVEGMVRLDIVSHGEDETKVAQIFAEAVAQSL